MAIKFRMLRAAGVVGALALLGAQSCSWAQGATVTPPVRVEFERPEQFIDAADRDPADDRARAFYLGQMRRHLAERALPLLRAGERLHIVITAMDRAGAFEPWRRGLGDVRIVRNVHPVRIELRFRIEDASGAVLGSGERKLSDSFFLDRWYGPLDPLRYEKALLDEWLERELGKSRA